MAPPCPRLRPDLVVTQIEQDGRALVQLEIPDRKPGRRVSQRAYQALLLLDGETSADEWMTSYAQQHPGVSAESMKRLLEGLIRDGYCQSDADFEDAAEATVILPGLQVVDNPGAGIPETMFVTDPHLVLPGAAGEPQARTPCATEELLRNEDFPPLPAAAEQDVNATTAPVQRKRGTAERAPSGAEPRRALVPKVAAVPRSDTGQKPLRRQDLVASRPNAAGQVAVKNPNTGRSFPIEGFEYAALQLMDGNRTPADIIDELAGWGRSISSADFARIVRQLNAYGFLESTGGAEEPVAPGPEDDSAGAAGARQPEWTAEQRELFEGGLTLFRQGQLEQAESYFESLLELAPDNPETRSMLERVRQARAQAAVPVSTTAPPAREIAGPPPDSVEAEAGGGEQVAGGGEQAADDGGGEEGEDFSPDTPPLAQGAEVWDQAKSDVTDSPEAVRRRWKMRLRRLGKVLIVPAALLVLSLIIWIPLNVTYPCLVKPLRNATVRAPMDGVVAEILVDEGMRVDEGQPLGRMQAADLKTDLAKSEAEFQRISAELDLLKQGSRQEEIDKAQARVAGLRREVGVASARVGRLHRLLKQGVAPRAELEQAQAQLASVSGQLKQAEAELKLTQAGAREDDLKRKQAELNGVEAQLELNRKLLAASELKAPMAGIVTSPKPRELINTRVGQGDALLEIALLDRMRLEILVSERDFDVLEIGQRTSARVTSFPTREFTGQVTRIPQRVEVVEGNTVIRVESEIENVENMLRPNMTGYAKITGDKMPVLGIVMRRVVRWIRVRFLI
ncbi:MAG: efflux RND transporter periplasmic adaptor subunit [Deltaproteobacteria bacterium]|nr:efflux RND transporter periplasmic adaptor subunit [Deltaproteobacteria bacterium]